MLHASRVFSQFIKQAHVWGYIILPSTKSLKAEDKYRYVKISYLAKTDQLLCTSEVEPVGQDDAGKT